MEAELTGRCWRFGDNINTDLIWPTAAYRVAPEERVKFVFSALRPGWYRQVRPGDIIIAGSNFGTGSGRAAASLLSQLKVAAVVARSFNGLFFRGSINAGLPVVQCDVPEDRAPEGSQITIDVIRGIVRIAEGTKFVGVALPEELWDIISSGGIVERLRRNGYLERSDS